MVYVRHLQPHGWNGVSANGGTLLHTSGCYVARVQVAVVCPVVIGSRVEYPTSWGGPCQHLQEHRLCPCSQHTRGHNPCAAPSMTAVCMASGAVLHAYASAYCFSSWVAPVDTCAAVQAWFRCNAWCVSHAHQHVTAPYACGGSCTQAALAGAWPVCSAATIDHVARCLGGHVWACIVGDRCWLGLVARAAGLDRRSVVSSTSCSSRVGQQHACARSHVNPASRVSSSAKPCQSCCERDVSVARVLAR
jgi:hypothetical protein